MYQTYIHKKETHSNGVVNRFRGKNEMIVR